MPSDKLLGVVYCEIGLPREQEHLGKHNKGAATTSDITSTYILLVKRFIEI